MASERTLQQRATSIARFTVSTGRTDQWAIDRLSKVADVSPEVAANELRGPLALSRSAFLAAASITANDPNNPPNIPIDPELDSAFSYTVVFHIECPDGSSDSYPVVVQSSVPLSSEEIDAIATGVFRGLVVQKGTGTNPSRFQLWDVDRKTGRKCRQWSVITEAWGRS